MAIDGFAIVPRAVLRHEGLSGYAKLVYALLASRINGSRACYPSVETLAEESGWSRPTVIHAITELVQLGLVERQHRRFHNTYVLPPRTESTSVTPLETESTTVTPLPTESTPLQSTTFTPSGRNQRGLPTESTTFTDGVNHVDRNETHLTRDIEGEDGSIARPEITGEGVSGEGRAERSPDAQAVLTYWQACVGAPVPPPLNPTQAAKLETWVVRYGVAALEESIRTMAERGVTELDKHLKACETHYAHPAPPVALPSRPAAPASSVTHVPSEPGRYPHVVICTCGHHNSITRETCFKCGASLMELPVVPVAVAV